MLYYNIRNDKSGVPGIRSLACGPMEKVLLIGPLATPNGTFSGAFADNDDEAPLSKVHGRRFRDWHSDE